jgi:putative lipase involved disintegration of autophagic bodies
MVNFQPLYSERPKGLSMFGLETISSTDHDKELNQSLLLIQISNKESLISSLNCEIFASLLICTKLNIQMNSILLEEINEFIKANI